MGRHPTSFTVKRSGFLKSIPAPHNGSFWGMGGVFEEEQHRHIPEVEGRTKPHLTRYFSWDHIHLSPIFFICDFIDKDTNFFELWAVVSQRQTVLCLCVLWGPDSRAQCDLLEVISWTSARWQLKNEHLKILFRPPSGSRATQTLLGSLFFFYVHLPYYVVRWTVSADNSARL